MNVNDLRDLGLPDATLLAMLNAMLPDGHPAKIEAGDVEIARNAAADPILPEGLRRGMLLVAEKMEAIIREGARP